jgi:hypothetical protein
MGKNSSKKRENAKIKDPQPCKSHFFRRGGQVFEK